MQINKYEAFGIAISLGALVLALWLFRVDSVNETLTGLQPEDQSAAVYVADSDNDRGAIANAILDASEGAGNITRLIIDDVVIGNGPEVTEGDTVAVHYIGTLQNGQQFKNTRVEGEPFTFTVGAGRVIEGWEKGVIGMREGGQRILVIPPHLAYGSEGSGPIPGNATLVFAVELVSVNQE